MSRLRLRTFAALALLLCLSLAPRAEAQVLRFLGAIVDTDGPFGLVGARGIAVSPEGTDVLVVGFMDNTLVLLSRSAATGRLSHAQTLEEGSDGVEGVFRPVGVVVAPDGRDVYVASYFGDAVVAFRRTPGSGEVSYHQTLYGGAEGILGLTQVRGLAISPDGAHLYAASFGDSALTTMARNPATGEIGVVDVQVDGEGGLEGLFRAFGVTVSPDGRDVFVVAGGTNSLLQFRRDEFSGQPLFLRRWEDGVDDVSGLEVPVSVAVSPDGRHVYALGDNGLALFHRPEPGNPAEYVGVETEGIVNAQGTSSPSSVAVSGDGRFVYVARAGDNALAVLARDPASGRLRPRQDLREGEDGVGGLFGATTVAVSPDDASVYVASEFGDAVAHFQREIECAGDCNGNGEVTVDEILRGVNLSLEVPEAMPCRALDTNFDGAVRIDELVRAVNLALSACPAPIGYDH